MNRSHLACNPHKFSAQGRLDRNRTYTLRLWSLLPFVQGRTRADWKTLISWVQRAWTCTIVHRRGGQPWGQRSAREHTLFLWTDQGLPDESGLELDKDGGQRN